MTGTGADRVRNTAGEGDALAEAVRQALPPVSLRPLLGPTAGAFAAATAMGFGFASQMTGAYLGFLKGAMEQTRLIADAFGAPVSTPLEEEAPVREEAVATEMKTATVLPLARKAKPASRPVKDAPKAKKRAKFAAGKAGATSSSAEVKGRGDDLKRISGIGPKLEQMLRARGISDLAAIAAFTETEALALDEALGLDGRIARDGWIAAAAALAK